MDELLLFAINTYKKLENGDLPNFPDPEEPGDLGDPLTQDEINTLKKFVKELQGRFVPSCNEEKTGVSITDTQYNNFTLSWSNPIGYTGTVVMYRVYGDSEWLVPNALGNATGSFGVDDESFTFDTGFTVGEAYELRVQNVCPNSITSAGVESQDTATDTV